MLKFPATPQPLLDALVKAALEHKMTPAEVFEQRVSWVYGQLPSTSKQTKDEVRQHLKEYYGYD